LSTAHRVDDGAQLVRITHPFHPLFGEEFVFVDLRYNWGEERVYYIDHDGALAIIPARWTSVTASDPFVLASAGRSYFRIHDLLALSRLLKGLEGQRDE
jgi:hypothetical protein